MRCIVLAAGYATRLYPLTENFPKPLLKVGDRTILDYLLDDIDSCGLVSGHVVVTNQRFYGHFCEWAASRGNVSVLSDGTSTNETRLGAVRDLAFSIESLGQDEDILVVAGDNLLDFTLKDFLEYASRKGTSCVMRYFESEKDRLRRSAVLDVDADDMVLHMEEKPSEPRSHWCCPPFYYYTAADAALVSEALCSGCSADAPGSFAAWLSSRTRMHAMLMPGRRHDIGTLESYRRACELFSSRYSRNL